MTGLEKITNEIQRAANAEAEEIIGNAKSEAQEILNKNNEKISAEKAELLAEAKKTVENLSDSVDSHIELVKSQELLRIKQQIITEILLKSQNRVLNMSDEEYLELLSKLAQKTDVSGKCVVTVNANDRVRLGEKFLESFPAGVQAEYSEQAGDMAGGFLLTCGNITINSTIEALFDNNEDELREIAANSLFS